MKRLFVFVLFGAVIAACAPLAQQPQVLPTARPTLTATAAPTATVQPTQPAIEAAEAAAPPDEPVSVADAGLTDIVALGEDLFLHGRDGAVPCAGCHSHESDARLMGPGLLTVAERAANRVEGMTAEEYLRESIVDPSAFVVRGFINMMPKDFGAVYSDEDIDALVTYLMLLNQPDGVQVAAEPGVAG